MDAGASFNVELCLEENPSLVYREGVVPAPKVKEVGLRKRNQSPSMITIGKNKKN